MSSRTPRTFADHLRELRQRLFVSIGFFLLGGTVAYVVHADLLRVLQQPLHQTLYYTTPAGAFNLTMKLSVLGGVLLLLPVAMYNLAAFVQPALKRQLGRLELQLLTILSLVLAVGGGLFAYFVVVPMSLGFFRQFNQPGFQSLISASDYVNFVVNCLIAFVIIFQLPLFLLFIDRITPLPPKRLWHYERHVIVASLIIALILPFTYDPLTQFMIALPIILLYNLSIIFILLAHRSQRRRHAVAQAIRLQSAARKVEPTVAHRPPAATRPVLATSIPAPRPQPAARATTPVRSIDGVTRPIPHADNPATSHAAPARPAHTVSRPGLIADVVARPASRQANYQARGKASYSRSLAIPGIDMRPRLVAESQ